MRNLFILSLLFLSSCIMDSIYYAELINSSRHDIHVIINFDRKNFDSVYQGKSYNRFIQDLNPPTYLAKFDSVNLKSEYIIPVNGLIRIEDGTGGRGAHPEFLFVKEVTIQKGSNNSVTYDRKMLGEAFKETGGGAWQFRVN